jgi:hypothetical protein
MDAGIYYIELTDGTYQSVRLGPEGKLHAAASGGGTVSAFSTPAGLDHVIACSSRSIPKYRLPPTEPAELCGCAALKERG